MPSRALGECLIGAGWKPSVGDQWPLSQFPGHAVLTCAWEAFLGFLPSIGEIICLGPEGYLHSILEDFLPAGPRESQGRRKDWAVWVSPACLPWAQAACVPAMGRWLPTVTPLLHFPGEPQICMLTSLCKRGTLLGMVTSGATFPPIYHFSSRMSLK